MSTDLFYNEFIKDCLQLDIYELTKKYEDYDKNDNYERLDPKKVMDFIKKNYSLEIMIDPNPVKNKYSLLRTPSGFEVLNTKFSNLEEAVRFKLGFIFSTIFGSMNRR
jgi:hypothetical protein